MYKTRGAIESSKKSSQKKSKQDAPTLAPSAAPSPSGSPTKRRMLFNNNNPQALKNLRVV